MILTYDFTHQTVVVTGGTGVLLSEIASTLAHHGANVVLLARDRARAERVLATFSGTPGRHAVIVADVLDQAAIADATATVVGEYGAPYALVNGAGGNDPRATTGPTQSFFDLSPEALDAVVRLNLQGTVLPCQAFGRVMSQGNGGVILNVTSMSAERPMTRVMAYSAAKAAVTNFTQWLAVHLAQAGGRPVRVNALAPGFFLTEQNRFLLVDAASGELTERGRKIIDHTPLGRFGQPVDLLGAALWLLSPTASFVTGAVIPVDGGFSAYSGV